MRGGAWGRVWEGTWIVGMAVNRLMRCMRGRGSARMGRTPVRQERVWLAGNEPDELYEECLGIGRRKFLVDDVLAERIEHLDGINIRIRTRASCLKRVETASEKRTTVMT